MAEGKDGGILAIVAGGGKPEKGSKEKTGGASSAKARSLQSMSEAMKAGNFDEAAEHFQAAYDECAMHSAEADEGDDEDT
ncbi:MAG TPA: hypothetical protein VFZ53_24980, partial [Polyangiaceae bacterium]